MHVIQKKSKCYRCSINIWLQLNFDSLQTLMNNFWESQYKEISTTALGNILISFLNRWLLHSVFRWHRQEGNPHFEGSAFQWGSPWTQGRNKLYIKGSILSRFTASWKCSWVHGFFIIMFCCSYVCDILKHWLLCLFFIKNIIKHLGVCTEITVTSIYNWRKQCFL